MKSKKQLVLNKITLVNLDNTKMNDIRGGIVDTPTLHCARVTSWIC